MTKIADYLRGRNGMKIRQGIERSKRVEYCKGSRLVKFLLKNSGTHHLPPFEDEESLAMSIGTLLIQHGFMHKSDRDTSNQKKLTISRDQSFEMDGYFTWMYDGPMTLRYIMTGALIVFAAMMTLFPIWPAWARLVIWYMSVTFLIVIIVFSILRLIAFLLAWMLGFDFWVLPNIYDDDLGVIESFKPGYSFKATDMSERKYRVVGIVAFIAFCYWVHSQPTDFDDYMEFTKQFTEDIYSGKMLDEFSQKQKDSIDRLIPDYATLMAEEEDDEKNVDNVEKDEKHTDDEGEGDVGKDNDDAFNKMMEEDAREAAEEQAAEEAEMQDPSKEEL